jgi:hypothetical protein
LVVQRGGTNQATRDVRELDNKYICNLLSPSILHHKTREDQAASELLLSLTLPPSHIKSINIIRATVLFNADMASRFDQDEALSQFCAMTGVSPSEVSACTLVF